MDLKREINISKKFIIIMLLVNIIAIGLQTSYAYFQVNVIKKSVVVIKTAVITMSIESQDLTNNKTLSLAAGESKTVTLTITNESEHDALARLYYIGDITDITFESDTIFKDENNIPIGRINKGQSQELTITITNNTESSTTIELGAQEGLIGYDLPLYEGRNSITLIVPPTPANVIVANAIANKKATNSSCTNITVEEDGITYLSGDNTCIDFNYVWYSGKLWRITAINADGTIKMITEDMITSIDYGEDADNNFYTDENTTSWIYQWLNEDFLNTLYNYENIIITVLWNATDSNAKYTSDIGNKLAETVMVPAKVGLINSYEYYMSYKNTDYSSGYLNIGYSWWLLNKLNSSSSKIWCVFNDGNTGYHTSSNGTGGWRPSVILKSDIQLSGSGTKSDPYKIKGDKEDAEPNTTKLNTRTSGEYVNFDGELYRIVGIENNTTKLNKADYVRDESNTSLTKNIASNRTYGMTTNTQSDDYWDYYLNNTWYNGISSTYKSMLEKGTYYIGVSGYNYKLAICATASNTVTIKECEKTNIIYSGYVGLPRYGEIFATQQGSGYQNSSYMCLITRFDSNFNWTVDFNGVTNYISVGITKCAARPSIHLSSSVKITGGTGLPDDPYEISL